MRKIFLRINILCLTLLSCNSSKPVIKNEATIEGTWELNYISGARIAFEGLYPNKKPTIVFDLKENRVSGNNSCNNYTGKLNVEGNKISFSEPMAVTRMMCMDGQGETAYMSTLQKISSILFLRTEKP